MSSESSSSSSSSEQPQTKTEKPLFTSDPIEYIKIESETNEQGQTHVFIVDKDALRRYAKIIDDLINIQTEMASLPQSSSSSGTSLCDDGAETSEPQIAIEKCSFEFREIPKRAIETICDFAMWKKRWANVVTERIPDFPLPSEKNHALHVLVASNELRC